MSTYVQYRLVPESLVDKYLCILTKAVMVSGRSMPSRQQATTIAPGSFFKIEPLNQASGSHDHQLSAQDSPLIVPLRRQGNYLLLDQQISQLASSSELLG